MGAKLASRPPGPPTQPSFRASTKVHLSWRGEAWHRQPRPAGSGPASPADSALSRCRGQTASTCSLPLIGRLRATATCVRHRNLLLYPLATTAVAAAASSSSSNTPTNTLRALNPSKPHQTPALQLAIMNDDWDGCGEKCTFFLSCPECVFTFWSLSPFYTHAMERLLCIVKDCCVL